MRLAIIIVMAAKTALGFTDPIWMSPPALYTNAIGMEFVQETVLRSRWAGDTNYNYTTTVSGVTYTNIFGSNPVYFVASEADKITAQIDSLMPSYVWPWFSRDPDYCFDDWWTNNSLDRWPGTLYPKAELMNQYAECGIATLGTSSNTTIIPEHTGFWEIIPVPVYDESNNLVRTDYPAGWWIKRRNRTDPLIVAEWARYNRDWLDFEGRFDSGVVVGQRDIEYYRGWPNEFSSGDTHLFGLAESNYPVFVVHPGGSNVYTGGLSLKLSDGTAGAMGEFYPVWYWYSTIYPMAATEWTNNRVNDLGLSVSFGPAMTGWDDWSVDLTSATQRCDRAWLSLGVPLTLFGTPPNSRVSSNTVFYYSRGERATKETYDMYERYYPGSGSTTTNVTTNSSCTVTLQYTNRMNTYEGTKVWDNTLLPEQLTAHYIAMTNAFLTPWPTNKWGWTNSFAYAYETNISMVFTNDHDRTLVVTGDARGGYAPYSVNGIYAVTGPGITETWVRPDVGYWYYGDYLEFSHSISKVSVNVYDLTQYDHYWHAYSVWRSSNGVVGTYAPFAGYHTVGTPLVNYQRPEVLQTSAGVYDTITSPRYPRPTNIWWWIATDKFPLYPNPWVIKGVGPVALSNNVAPFESFTANATGDFNEVYDASTTDVNTNNDPVIWSVSASRTETPILINASGMGVISSIAVTGLYTGTPHRVHLYAKSPRAMAPLGPSEYYHRIGIYPVEFTTDDTIITDPVDPRQTNAWAVRWTNQWSTTAITNVNTVFPSLEPYVKDDSLLPDYNGSYTHVAYASETNFVTNGWTYADVGVTNINDVNYALIITTPTVEKVITNYTMATNTVCGWAQVYYNTDWGTETPKKPPTPYSWPGYSVSNAVITNYFGETNSLVYPTTNGMPLTVNISGITFQYISDILYSDLGPFSAGWTIRYVEGVWTLTDFDDTPLAYAINGIASTYTYLTPPPDTLVGSIPATNFVQVVTNSVRNYDKTPTGWEAWTGSPAFFPQYWDPPYHYQDHAWVWMNSFDPKIWRPEWFSHPQRYSPFQGILVPIAQPSTSNVVVGYNVQYGAHEWLAGNTNWSSSVEVKVLIEWQR